MDDPGGWLNSQDRENVSEMDSESTFCGTDEFNISELSGLDGKSVIYFIIRCNYICLPVLANPSYPYLSVRYLEYIKNIKTS